MNPKAVPFSEEFLDASWRWLQDPEIKRLVMAPDFTREAQREWFDSLCTRKDYIILGVEFDGSPIGAFGIKGIEKNRGEYWGYIGEKNMWGKGIGRWMLKTAFGIAAEAGIKMLHLKVSRDNERAIELYRKMGFRETSAPNADPVLMGIART